MYLSTSKKSNLSNSNFEKIQKFLLLTLSQEFLNPFLSIISQKDLNYTNKKSPKNSIEISNQNASSWRAYDTHFYRIVWVLKKYSIHDIQNDRVWFHAFFLELQFRNTQKISQSLLQLLAQFSKLTCELWIKNYIKLKRISVPLICGVKLKSDRKTTFQNICFNNKPNNVFWRWRDR